MTENAVPNSYYIHEVKAEYEGVPLETKETWILLCRLLHRMKTQEQIPEDAKNQTWHSLIMRAQMAQDMWKSISHEVAARDFQVYQSMSNKVDHLCRKAHRLAEERREQSPPDLIDDIFFSNEDHESDSSNSDDDSSHSKGEVEDRSEDEHRSDASVESGGNDANDRIVRLDTSQRREAKSTTPMTNEELQKAQREQMEEAIAQMAQHMKEATKGISNTLRKQNENTLNDLENIAEQNVQEMSQVTTDVTEHNQKQWRKNFSTWSMMFLLVGIFVFTMLMIFTLPKHPTASLLGKGGMIRSSLSWVSKSSMGIAGWAQEQAGIMGGSNDNDGNDTPPARKGEWEHLFDENEEERRQKEKLDNFIANRQEGDSQRYGSDDEMDAKVRQDGMGDSFAGRNAIKPKQKSSKKKPNMNDEADENDGKQGGDPANVNMDELIASLNRQKQKTLEEQKEFQQKEKETESKGAGEEMKHKTAAQQRRERDDARRLERQKAARKAKEEERARVQAEEVARLEAERLEAERLAQKEQARKERLEAVRIAREEAGRKAKEEARVRAEEEAARAEVERQAREEKDERDEALGKAREEETEREREKEDRKRTEELENAQAERFAQIEHVQREQEDASQLHGVDEIQRANDEAQNAQADRFAQLEREQREREEALLNARRAQEEEEARVRAEEAAAAEAERIQQEKLRKEEEEALQAAREEAARKQREAEEARSRAAQAARVEAERRALEEERVRLEREAAWRQAREEAAREEEVARKNPHDSEDYLQERLQHIEATVDHRASEEKRARMEDAMRHDEELNMEEYVERGREKLDEYLGRQGHDEL